MADEKRVLILNAGSSSLKWVVLSTPARQTVTQGTLTWRERNVQRHSDEIRAVVETLPAVDAVGHRVVHGGDVFTRAVLVSPDVRVGIATLAHLAPLHNPAALSAIDAISAQSPMLPQIAAFDTSFHATIGPSARYYALPWQWTQQWSLRRFGFHGLSVQYAVQRVTTLLGHCPARLIVCHLGAGCSITAVENGISVDTSMGYTPLDGVMMATRSGAVDPGLLLALQMDHGLTAPEILAGLEERAGLLGVSELSGDFREIVMAKQNGHAGAALAYAMFCRRLVHTIGGMIAVLGGCDCLVYTGGIGEHSADLRRDVTSQFVYAGLTIDDASNRVALGDACVSEPEAPTQIWVVTAREDLAILDSVQSVMGWPP